MSATGTWRSPRRRLGLTLIEVVASVVISGLLLGGTAATVHVMTRGGAQVIETTDRQNSAALVLARLRGELRLATAASELGPHAVTFTAPTSGGKDEVIRYAWSGKPGDDLTRKAGSAGASVVLPQVQQFDLSYELMSVQEIRPPAEVESAETLLYRFDVTDDTLGRRIEHDDQSALYVEPKLADEVLSWRITRLWFQAKESGSTNGEVAVQLRTALADGQPSNTVLAELPMYETGLDSSYTWQEFVFDGADGQPRGEGIVVVLKWVSDAEACRVLVQEEDAYPSDSIYMRSRDGGASWPDVSGQTVPMHVYGKVTTASAPEVVDLSVLRAVQIDSSSGTSPPARLRSGVRLLNSPDASGL